MLARRSNVPDRSKGTREKETPPLLRKRLFTLKEAAEYLGRSEWGVRELIWGGSVPVVRVAGGRKIFVDILDLMEFIEKNKSTYQ